MFAPKRRRLPLEVGLRLRSWSLLSLGTRHAQAWCSQALRADGSWWRQADTRRPRMSEPQVLRYCWRCLAAATAPADRLLLPMLWASLRNATVHDVCREKRARSKRAPCMVHALQRGVVNATDDAAIGSHHAQSGSHGGGVESVVRSIQYVFRSP